MDQPLSPQEQGSVQKQASPKRWLKWGSLGLGTGALLMGLGGSLWLRNYIQVELAPEIQMRLTNILQRPVEMGPLEGVSLSEVTFGASEIPATETDQDWAKAPVVKARFNPLQVLLQRQLYLDLVLVEPELYLDQDPDGRWLIPTLNLPEPGWLDIRVETVAIERANVTALPIDTAGDPLPLVRAVDLNGDVRVNGSELQADVSGSLEAGGNFAVDLTAPVNFVDGTVTVTGKDASVPVIFSIVEQYIDAPVDLTTGQGSGEVTLNWRDRRLDLNNASGTLAFDAVTLAASPLSQSFTELNGRVRFGEQMIRLQTVQGRYGELNAVLEGTIDLEQGLDIAATVQPAPISAALQTLGVTLELPVTGEVEVAAQLT
ncbi:MAG: hypothetical protein AAGF24_14635, partial [Cyanobacteria bacterium P01_H01_bin.121]